MKDMKKRTTMRVVSPTVARQPGPRGPRDGEDDPADMLVEVLALSGADLEPAQVHVVIYVVPATVDDPRWTWFLDLRDGGMGCVSALRSDHPEDDGWTAPEVTRADTLIGLVRAADPAHGARFLRFVVEVTSAGHFQTSGGRPILNVTPPGPMSHELRIGLVMLAANVLLIRDRSTGDSSADLHASLWVNCAGHFAPDLAADVARGAGDAEAIGMADLPGLYLLWCLDSAWGPVAWCAAARRQVPPLGSEARGRLAMSGYDLEALARGELPREIEIARRSSSGLDLPVATRIASVAEILS
jgi:hypothetical protein